MITNDLSTLRCFGVHLLSEKSRAEAEVYVPSVAALWSAFHSTCSNSFVACSAQSTNVQTSPLPGLVNTVGGGFEASTPPTGLAYGGAMPFVPHAMQATVPIPISKPTPGPSESELQDGSLRKQAIEAAGRGLSMSQEQRQQQHRQQRHQNSSVSEHNMSANSYGDFRSPAPLSSSPFFQSNASPVSVGNASVVPTSAAKASPVASANVNAGKFLYSVWC